MRTRFSLPAVEVLEGRLLPTAYTVTTTKDLLGDTAPGELTLRDALTALDGTSSGNATAVGTATNTITFAIPGSGPRTITVGGGNVNRPLPSVTRQVFLDGWSQGGSGYHGAPLIVLTGVGNLTLAAGSDNSTVRGFVIQQALLSVGIEVSGSGGNLITANYVGTDANGVSADGNDSVGIQIDNGATANTVGGTAASAGNLISGGLTGVVIEGVGTSGNVLLGNRIGTDKSGTAAIGSGGYPGVQISGGATANTVGGTAAGAGNLIAGNGDMGVWIKDSGTSANAVLGNTIGTDPSGTVALANFGGVAIDTGATANSVGGTAPGAGNLISGNKHYGVEIGGAGASGNVVLGNLIGTDRSGTVALGNGDSGVMIEGGATDNTVGGTATGAGNVISANGRVGVLIGQFGLPLRGGLTSGNVVLGNLIGTDVSGTLALGNEGSCGVSLSNGATADTIGGTAAGAANVVSGNKNDGIDIGGSGNLVLGNRVGTDLSGTLAIGNGFGAVFPIFSNGIVLGGTDNTVGGIGAGAANVISGNAGTGVSLQGGGTSGNVLLGNLIGSDATGEAALPNGNVGVSLGLGASNDTVGGTAAGAGNLISGNGGGGIGLGNGNDYHTSGNVIQGNLIGTDLKGTAKLPNRGVGIDVLISTGNTIGGTAPGAGNVISGNTGAGIVLGQFGLLLLEGPGSGNVVQGNFIGTDRTGTLAMGNGGDGVQLVDIASACTVAGNVISANAKAGVEITQLFGPPPGADLVRGNFIGTDPSGTLALGNGGDGVLIDSGAINNTVGGTAAGDGNTIAFNAKGVVVTRYDSTGNSILGNSIYGNSNLGIDLGDDGPTPNGANPRAFPNDGQNTPILSRATTIGVTGSLTSVPATPFRLEFFASPRGEGPGQGQTFLGFLNVTTGATGAAPFTATLSIPQGVKVSATATDLSTGDTSEFSPYVVPSVVTTFTVTTTKDLIDDTATGEVTLRDVLTAIDTQRPSGNAPAGSGINVIKFAVGARGSVQTITLGSALPVITQQVFLDGWSQGGSHYSGRPLIVLNGAGAGGDTDGLSLAAGSDGSTVLGLVVQNFGDDGIVLSGTNGNLIAGNYVGTDATGTADRANHLAGIYLTGGASANTIGGTASGAGNVVSANYLADIYFSQPNTSGNVVLGNLLGTNRAGTAAVGHSAYGVLLLATVGNAVGGASSGAGNVIAGASSAGIGVQFGNGNLIAGNFIGTDPHGVARLGNADGIVFEGAAEQNTVSGNAIAFNGKGVVVRGGAVGDSILGNSIYGNSNVGIDLGDDGPTPNGANPRNFPNDGQNTPLITALTPTGVSGTLKSVANATFRLEFFASPAAGSAGQGQTFLGSASVTTKADGTASFTATFSAIPAGDVVTATATNLDTGDTSEFSPVGPQFVVLTNPTIPFSAAAQVVVLRAQLFLGSTPSFGSQVAFTVTGLRGSVTGTVDAAGLVKVRFTVPAGTPAGAYMIVARYAAPHGGATLTANGLLTVLPPAG